MGLAVYYILLLVGFTGWPPFHVAKGLWRIPWFILGMIVTVLPVLLPLKQAFYYGLIAHFTAILWSADTWMGKEDRRVRGVIGGSLLALLPSSWRWPVESWLGVLVVPTLGHLLVSGTVWALIVVGRGRISKHWLG